MRRNSCSAQRERLHVTSVDLSILNKMLLSFTPKGHRWFYIDLPIHFKPLPIQSISPKETAALGVFSAVITLFSHTHPGLENSGKLIQPTIFPLGNLSKWSFTCEVHRTEERLVGNKTFFLPEEPWYVLFFLILSAMKQVLLSIAVVFTGNCRERRKQ